MLSIFGDSITLRLLRSRNGTTGIFSSYTNTEQESEASRRGSEKKNVSQVDEEVIATKRGLAAERRLQVYFDSPTGSKHGKHSTKAVVGAARSG